MNPSLFFVKYTIAEIFDRVNVDIFADWRSDLLIRSEKTQVWKALQKDSKLHDGRIQISQKMLRAEWLGETRFPSIISGIVKEIEGFKRSLVKAERERDYVRSEILRPLNVRR